MTRFERLQKKTIFKAAGVKAFLMCIHVKSNPYSLQPFHDLWADGYRQVKRQFKVSQFTGRDSLKAAPWRTACVPRSKAMPSDTCWKDCKVIQSKP